MKPDGNQHSAATLRERLKELECLYALANISAEPNIDVKGVLQKVAEVLPSAWQFAEHACVVIDFDDITVYSHPQTVPHLSQHAAISLNNKTRGKITIGYPEGFKPPDNAPLLLDEEQRLLLQAARKVAGIVEQIETANAHERMQEQLRHADRLATIGQLAAGVAHELNEPLGGILGFAQLLAKNNRLDETARNDIGKIEKAALHARDIIRKLMFFSRQAPPCLGPVSLNRIITESASLWSWRCEDCDIQVHYSLADDLPELMADENQLRQVVTNLVVNAIQSMPEGGVLAIETVAGENRAELIVRDSGEGIDPEVMPHLFDPFFTTKDVDQGTGLGLSVVHGIVTAHDGEISVESEQQKGTTMHVRFPIKNPQTKNTGKEREQ